MVAACQRATYAGYTLALDDYDGRSSLDTLLPFVRIVKLDVLDVDPATLAPRIARLRGLGIRVLAERVETVQSRAAYAKLGCELFQGFVFSRPETVDGRSLSVDQLSIVNAIGKLADETITDDELADAFRTHPSLSLGLLRLVNAASFSARSVESIPHALRLVGRQALSRWMMVMLVASAPDATPVVQELMAAALTRARFAELVCEAAGGGDPAAHFRTALLSRLDLLLGEPLESLVRRLPIAADVRDALLERKGPMASALALVDAYERGEWHGVDDVPGELPGAGSSAFELSRMFGDASDWAGRQLGG